MKMIAGAIFDLDGTLINSEDNYYISDKLFLSRYGIDFDDEFRFDMVGRGAAELFRIISERYPENGINAIPIKELLRQKDETYIEYAEGHTEVFPRMLELLESLKARKLPLAIASGSTPAVIGRMLELTGLSSFFDTVVSSVEVARGKPFPDVFVEAARRLGVSPERCLVFEDSQFGVEAAKRAGMYCVAVPTVFGKALPAVFRSADLLFEDGQESFSVNAVLDWCAV
jgi:beta-phosphoglucomutase family hydrolase